MVLYDGSTPLIGLMNYGKYLNKYKIVKELEMSLHHLVIIICTKIKNYNLPLTKVKLLYLFKRQRR
jgi:hypothetical protein